MKGEDCMKSIMTGFVEVKITTYVLLLCVRLLTGEKLLLINLSIPDGIVLSNNQVNII